MVKNLSPRLLRLIIFTYILQFSLLARGQIDSDKSAIDYAKHMGNLIRAGKLSEGVQVLDSGINFFTKKKIDSKAFLEYWKAEVLFQYIGLDSCVRYIDRILEEYNSGQRDASPYQGVLLLSKSKSLLRQGKFNKSLSTSKEALDFITIYDSSLKIFNTYRDAFIGQVYNGIATGYRVINKLDSTIFYSEQAMKYTDTTSPSYIYGLLNLALIYSYSEKCTNAQFYIERSKEKIRLINAANMVLADYYDVMARISLYCLNFLETIEYADSAVKYQQKSKKNSFYQYNQVHLLAANAHLHLGNYYAAFNECSSSLPLIRSLLIYENFITIRV